LRLAIERTKVRQREREQKRQTNNGNRVSKRCIVSGQEHASEYAQRGSREREGERYEQADSREREGN